MRRLAPVVDPQDDRRRDLEAAALSCYPGSLGYKFTDDGWVPDENAEAFWSPPCPPKGCDLHFVECPRRALLALGSL